MEITDEKRIAPVTKKNILGNLNLKSEYVLNLIFSYICNFEEDYSMYYQGAFYMSDTEEKDEMLFSEILEDMNNAIEGRNYTTEEFWSIFRLDNPINYETYEVEENSIVTVINID